MARRMFFVALVALLSLLVASDAQRLLKGQDAAPTTRALADATDANSSTEEEAATVVAASTDAESSTATTAESESGETHPKGPSLSSFTGPMIAGAVAIVLIGFVIAFKNRSSR